VFEDLAGEFELPYVPFLLEGVATDFDLMQSDGIHPTAEAQKLILSNMLPVVNKTLGH
jgi:acyl-CoA thioesterase-1